MTEIVADYTIEFTQKKVPTNYTKTSGPLYTSIRNPELMSRNDGQNYASYGYGFDITDSTWTNADMTGPVAMRIGNVVKYKVPSYAFGSNDFRVRMSAVGSTIQMYVGSDKLFDITDSTYSSGSTVAFNQTGPYAGTLNGVDDLSITSVVNYGELDFSGINYKGFNATRKVITLDFTGVNGSFDSSSFDGRIQILKKSGSVEEEIYDYTVTATEGHEGTDKDGNVMTVSKGNTVIITPADGLDTESLYKVVVYGGISDKTGMTLEDDATTGWFKVNELFADDFEVAFEEDGVTPKYPYYYYSDGTTSNRNGGLESSYWFGSYRKEFTGIYNGSNKEGGAFQFRNNSQWVTLTTEGLSASDYVSDYTVEYTMGLPASPNGPMHGIMLRDGALANNDFSRGSLFFVDNTGTLIFRPKNVIAAQLPGYLSAKQTKEVRVSAIGENVQWFIDNDKVMDLTDATVTGKGTISLFGGTTWNQSPHSTFDNVSITTVSKIGEIATETDILSYNADTDTVYLELDKTALAGNPLSENTLGGVKLLDKDGKELEASVSLQGDWILVKPSEKLAVNKKYTVEAKGLTTKYGTVVNDYSKAFKLVQVYKATFDTEESVTEGWSTKEIGSWDNGRMKLSNTNEATWDKAVDYIFSKNYVYTEEPEYVTEFDLYVYDNDSDSTNALTFNEFTFYSNKKHSTAYNQGANTLNYGFGLSRNLGIATGGGKSFYNAQKSSNFTLEAGKTINIKTVNKNGTGFFYVNDILEATYDYSEVAPLMNGCLGFKLGGQTVAGIDNILCTYATDYVDDGGESATPAIEITKAEISQLVEGKVTTDITVQNNTYDKANYVVAVALYDANHKLVGFASAKETASSIGTTKDYAPEITGVSGYSYAKVFLWDGLGTMNPIGTMREISGTTEIAYFVNPSADLMSADGTEENPYPTIAMAMDRVESEVESGAFNVNFNINVAEGDIVLNDTLEINDYNGELKSAGVTVTVEGQGTDKTFIKSGKTINNGDFYKVEDNEILSRVPSGAKNNIYAVNLVEKGYLNSGESLELSSNGKVQNVAKYPNSGYLKTGNVTEDAMSFECSVDRVSAWGTANDMYVYYMPNYFSYAYKVKAENGLITTANNAGFAKGKDYYVYNLIEELDSEGEYYYDIENGVLYVYSVTAPSAKYDIFNMEKILISLEYCDSVKFKNMTIENNGTTLVALRYTDNSGFENCVLRNGTKNAAIVTSGSNSGFLNCDIYGMGSGGVSLAGGNRDTLKKARNYVNKCSVHDCQRLDRSYTALVSMSGVGNYVVNSDIYNSYHMAISIYGNDLEIKNNKIYNVCRETTDMGAIYAEGDWTLRGTVIEHNYFENIPANGAMGAFAIYLDNGLSGITVKNNIFKDISRQAVYVNGGRDNLVTNNIFVDCGNVGAISDIYNWGAGYSFENPAPARANLVNKLTKVGYNEEPYTKYEHLANILEDKPSIPKYNKFTGNVIVNSGEITTAWLRNVTLDTLISEGGCEYDVSNLSTSDLTDYAGGDYTLTDDTANSIEFEWFDNSFGR